MLRLATLVGILAIISQNYIVNASPLISMVNSHSYSALRREKEQELQNVELESKVETMKSLADAQQAVEDFNTNAVSFLQVR